MKNIFSNINYFTKEARTMLKLNLLSNILSIVSISLIFCIFAMVIVGGWTSNKIVEVIQDEAEISVYCQETIGGREYTNLIEQIKQMEGVRDAQVVNEDQAYDRMVEILGQEASVLKLFDDNPFTAFIEVNIKLKEVDGLLEKIHGLEGVDHVRDNKQVLDRIQNIASILNVLGYLVVVAVGISTLIIISHIIRMGIYNNREQINTLRLLGAPETFIAFPFLIAGLLLTMGGGILASLLTTSILKIVQSRLAGSIYFIPLPALGALMFGATIVIMSMSLILGIMGSLIGLSSATK